MTTPLSQKHLLAQLARLDLLLRREALRARQMVGLRQDEDYRGLYVSEEELAALLDHRPGAGNLLAAPPLPAEDERRFSEALHAADMRCRSLEAALREQDRLPPLLALAERFQLSSLELSTLLLALAPELNLRYERIYAYLQDDVRRRRPTVDLALRLLCPGGPARLAGRARFGCTAPLMWWSLLRFGPTPEGTPPLIGRELLVDERVVSFLLAADGHDPILYPLLRAAGDGAPWRTVTPPLAAQQRVCTLTQVLRPGGAEVILISGPPGSGRRSLAASLAAGTRSSVLLLDAEALAAASAEKIETAVHHAEREARLVGALPVWLGAEALLHGAPPLRRAFFRALEAGAVRAVLLTTHRWAPGPSLPSRPVLLLELPRPGFADQAQILARAAAQSGVALSVEGQASLTGRFRMTQGQLHVALARAKAGAASRGQGALPTTEDIEAACRAFSQSRLDRLATRVSTAYNWTDLVLPAPQHSRLQALVSAVRQRPQVLGTWGFARRMQGSGLIALFAGPPGTGKTMAAGVIASALRLDLYKIDVSTVVSKYIGETEKNLERIFSEGEDSDAILFFDEADALFGKRGEISDARDRYANQEVSYLLQRTESYPGLIILATNLRKNIDDAFLRRFFAVVEFSMPDAAARQEIWQRSLPAAAPCADDVDLSLLAQRFTLSGGSIRNAMLIGAFLAADEDSAITMRHLVRGVAIELQKSGRMLNRADFKGFSDVL